MKPSPSLDEMSVFPQYKSYDNVFMLRGPSNPPPRTGRLGIRMVSEAHAVSSICLLAISVLCAFSGMLLLFKSISDPNEHAVLGGAGFGLLGASGCTLVGTAAICADNFRRQRELNGN